MVLDQMLFLLGVAGTWLPRQVVLQGQARPTVVARRLRPKCLDDVVDDWRQH